MPAIAVIERPSSDSACSRRSSSQIRSWNSSESAITPSKSRMTCRATENDRLISRLLSDVATVFTVCPKMGSTRKRRQIGPETWRFGPIEWPNNISSWPEDLHV